MHAHCVQLALFRLIEGSKMSLNVFHVHKVDYAQIQDFPILQKVMYDQMELYDKKQQDQEVP